MKVRYTRPALADLEMILEHVVERSPRGMKRVQARLKAFIALLPLHPFVGTRTDDPSIRRLVITPYPYLVFYEVGESEIIVHAVRHSARDPSSMPGSVRS